MKRLTLKQYLLGGVVVTIVAFSLLGMSSIPQYKTVTIKTGTVKKEIDFTTNWYPVGYAKVSLGSSQDIRKIHVKEGDVVSSGKVLAQLNDDTEYNQYKAAQASYYAAIKAKKNAAATPMTPQSTLDTLQGQINSAYYQVKNAEVNLNKKKVKAPITGKVITISVSDYTSASTSAASALTTTSSGNYIVLANNKDASFVANVSDRDRAKLQVGMNVTLTSRISDELLIGVVTKLAKTPVVAGVEDPTYQITMLLDEYPTSIPIGTKLEGSIIILDKPNVRAVQYDAVTVESFQMGTVLVLKDEKVETVNVGIGAVGDDVVEITSGLTENDEIAIDKLADKKILTFRPWFKKLFGIK